MHIPARYVGGYLVQSDGTLSSQAGHAWAEAHVGDLGWVGFDPSNGVCVTESYVRVAIGLDYLGAAPVRGSQAGGQVEALRVDVHTEDMAAQQ
jgi:transglutaminase-like putative cysteine protease